jgi:shikimate dehydrogenase
MRTLSGQARIAGVLGWPVAHSLSPRLHGCWLQRYRIDGAYVPLPVRPDDLEAALRALVVLGFAGANVTVPHKEATVAVVDTLTPAARRIGAVNTLIVGADGTLTGDNTDAFGFLENLKAAGIGPVAGLGPAVVLGAGGAARAVVAGLVDAGVGAIRLVNRSIGRAEALAAAIGGPIRVLAWADREAALPGAGLVVNTTTLGMTASPPLDLAVDALPAEAVVTDLVYAPLLTPLLAAASARGLRTVDGLGMLLHQARPGFRAWFGRDPRVTPALRRFVLAGRTP